LLYRKPFFFPIYGALRKSYSEEDDTWELYKRFGKMDDEYYQLMEVYKKEPNPDQMTKVIWGKR
jgi:adenylate kinase